MKKSVMLVIGIILLINLVVVVSAFSASSYGFTSEFNCSDFGVECGVASISYNEEVLYNNDENDDSLYYVTEKSCGECSTDKYCYNGKCVNINGFGICARDNSINECNSVPFPLGKPETIYESLCDSYGCNYDSKIKKCTGDLPSCSDLMKEKCSTLNGDNFNAKTGFCEYFNKSYLICAEPEMLFGHADEYIHNPNCKFSNIGVYEPKIYIYYKDIPTNLIYFSSEDLESIRAGNTIPISIKLVNSGLPKNTPVRFEVIFGGVTILGDGTIQKDVLSNLEGVVDEQGEVNIEWLLSNEELSKINFESGRDRGYNILTLIKEVSTRVEVYRSPIISYQDVSEVVSLKFKTKTGKCLGEFSKCEDYDSWYLCHEAESLGYDCIWNEETGAYSHESGSCTGGQAIPCDYSCDIKGVCMALGCTWKADSIFERFIDWIKSIFGG